MKRIALACVLALAAKGAAADEPKFSCFVEHSAGFTTETGAGWSAVSFKPNGRYRLRPATAGGARGQDRPWRPRDLFPLERGDAEPMRRPARLTLPQKTLRCDGLDAFRMNIGDPALYGLLPPRLHRRRQE